MAWTLTWNNATLLPVEAAGLLPLVRAAQSANEVARGLLPVGNTRIAIGDLFQIEGSGQDVQLRGDLRSVRRLGQGMEAGSLRIEGDVGPHLGRRMRGGTIDVDGSAGTGVGLSMLGGLIRIRGNVGDHLGSAEPGERLGMRDGVILVHGSIGIDAALGMRRGLIAVAGFCGAGLGRSMIAGSVFAFGDVGPGAGVGMKRGTLALFGSNTPRIAIGFPESGHDRPPFVTVYLHQLRQWGFPVPERAFAGPFSRYNGDRTAKGQGEILIHRGA